MVVNLAFLETALSDSVAMAGEISSDIVNTFLVKLDYMNLEPICTKTFAYHSLVTWY